MTPQIQFALRFGCACVLLIPILLHFAEVLVEPLLPLFEWVIGICSAEFRILKFGLIGINGDIVIQMQVTLAKPVFIGTQYLAPDSRGVAEVSTSVNHIFQVSVMFLAFTLTWAYQNNGINKQNITARNDGVLFSRVFNKLVLRMIIGLPILALIIMIDSPLVMLASLWRMILQNLALDNFSALIVWDAFLEGGGRLVLGLVAGMLTVWLTDILISWSASHVSNDNLNLS